MAKSNTFNSCFLHGDHEGDICPKCKEQNWNQVERNVESRLDAERNDAGAWWSLVARIGKELNCLPSSFPSGNDHLIDAIRKLKAQATIERGGK